MPSEAPTAGAWLDACCCAFENASAPVIGRLLHSVSRRLRRRPLSAVILSGRRDFAGKGIGTHEIGFDTPTVALDTGGLSVGGSGGDEGDEVVAGEDWEGGGVSPSAKRLAGRLCLK